MFGRKKQPPADAFGPRTHEELTAAEHAWLASNIATASRLVDRVAPEEGELPSLAGLHMAVTAWYSDRRSMDVNEFVNAIGSAFGAHLVNDTELHWTVATDSQGTEMAVTDASERLVIYPLNAVAKRVTAREQDFVMPLHRVMVEQVAKLAAGS